MEGLGEIGIMIIETWLDCTKSGKNFMRVSTSHCVLIDKNGHERLGVRG